MMVLSVHSLGFLVVQFLIMSCTVQAIAVRCSRDLDRRVCTSAERPCATIEHDLSVGYSGPDNGVRGYCMPNYCQGGCPRSLDDNQELDQADAAAVKPVLWLAAFEEHYDDQSSDELLDILDCLDEATLHTSSFSECFSPNVTSTYAAKRSLADLERRGRKSDCLSIAGSLAAPPNLGGGGSGWIQAVKILGKYAAASAITWYCQQLP